MKVTLRYASVRNPNIDVDNCPGSHFCDVAVAQESSDDVCLNVIGPDGEWCDFYSEMYHVPVWADQNGLLYQMGNIEVDIPLPKDKKNEPE